MKPLSLVRTPFHFCATSAPQIRGSMETAAALRSFQGGLVTCAQAAQPFIKKPSMSPISNTTLSNSSSRVSMVRWGILSSTGNQRGSLASHVKASETTSTLSSDVVASGKNAQGTMGSKKDRKSAFPNGFEKLVREVCDETNVTELKLKVGDFEMHLKRDVGTREAPFPSVPPIVSPTTAPPIPSEPMIESVSAVPIVVTQRTPAAATSPFANVLSSKGSKLAALEASGSNAYALVTSPTVGSFRKGRTLKGKRQPPSCKEGNIIKEGQVIGYLDQFGNELPIRSDVAGEVLKVLFDDGEAVGYGDPLVAVLPSFHGIRL